MSRIHEVASKLRAILFDRKTKPAATAVYPDVGYYYARSEDAAAIMTHGLPVGSVVQLQPLSEVEARAKYGYPADAEIVVIELDIRGLREAGYPLPPIDPAG